MHVHALDGCAPAPLAHYLKALGVLRLVAEQADPTARGWWDGERFRLATTLDERALIDFFATTCSPLPVFNPWGGRSGFYPGGSEKSAREALTAIETSTIPRLADYRAAIATTREVIRESFGGKKPSDEGKARLILELRKRMRGSGSSWIDSVTAILGSKDGEPDSAYPALFGTGGNEGSGSYTSAYMSAVVACVVQGQHVSALRATLFGTPTPAFDTKQNMLQFLPEGAASPWDLLLAVAGASLVRSSVAARIDSTGSRWMASPFYVAPNSFGYASAARLDEFFLQQGSERAGRGEQWFPLWSQPATMLEVSQLFSEGRASTKAKHATDGWSMARAAGTWGVRRGIVSFQRFGYLQRDNQSLHFAVPLGRFHVPERVLPAQSCLDDLDRRGWLATLHRVARHKDSPARLRLAQRRLMTELFDVCQRGESPASWQRVLHALGAVEAVMRTGSGFKAQPVPPLRPEWVPAADDGSAEFRLALALALQARAFRRDDGRPVDGLRRHWLPLDARRPGRFATGGDAMKPRLELLPDVVMQGRGGVGDAIAVLERRLVEASAGGLRSFPLQAAARAEASLADLSAWLTGHVDPDRTLALARALMALDRGLWAEQIVPITAPPPQAEWPDDAWLCLRLAHLPWPLPDGRVVPCDPAILRRLASGDAASAVEGALRRLRAAGLRPALRVAAVAPATARLWAAALAFPVSRSLAGRMARRLDLTFAQEQFA